MAQINIRAGEAVSGGAALGLMTPAGNPWTVSDAFGQELVNRGKAYFVAAPSNPSGTLTADEVQQVRASVSGAGKSGITYDGSGRMSGYTQAGIAYTITYPTSSTMVIAGGGAQRTVTLDGSNRVTSY